MSMRTDDEQEKVRAGLAQLLRNLRETWPLQLDLIGFKAKTVRARFLALLAEGFSVDEALRLCVLDAQL